VLSVSATCALACLPFDYQCLLVGMDGLLSVPDFGMQISHFPEHHPLRWPVAQLVVEGEYLLVEAQCLFLVTLVGGQARLAEQREGDHASVPRLAMNSQRLFGKTCRVFGLLPGLHQVAEIAQGDARARSVANLALDGQRLLVIGFDVIEMPQHIVPVAQRHERATPAALVANILLDGQRLLEIVERLVLPPQFLGELAQEGQGNTLPAPILRVVLHGRRLLEILHHPRHVNETATPVQPERSGLTSLLRWCSMHPCNTVANRLFQSIVQECEMRQSKKLPWVVLCVFLLLGVIISLGFLRVVNQLDTLTAHSQANQAATSPTRTLPSPTPTPTQPVLHVSGNQLLNASGQPVTLIGASHSSLEFLCSGDHHFQLADFQAMRSWGMNVVRIPLSSEFWANRNNDCPNYHLTVTSAIANAEAAGMYVILDLQWNAPLDLPADPASGGGQYPMPDTGKDLTFWEDLATIYHTDPGVIFDLFGEPHDISWNTWYKGGTLQTAIYRGNQIQGGQGVYQAIGMLDLATRVRAIAPENLILISGLDWGYDLSALTQGYQINLPNILYSTHPFEHGVEEPGNWPSAFGQLSQQVAVIAAEFGSYSCQTSYVSTAISYFQAHHMSWVAWGWEIAPCNTPSLITDWAGTPNVPYGAFIRQQMQAAAAGGA
jgi:endoglucanase